MTIVPVGDTLGDPGVCSGSVAEMTCGSLPTAVMAWPTALACSLTVPVGA